MQKGEIQIFKTSTGTEIQENWIKKRYGLMHT